MIDVYGYNGRYLISKDAEIYSHSKGRKLKPHISKSLGYRMVTLISNEGKKNVCYLHQLMAMSFLDKDYKSKGLVVDHINRDRADSRLSNLRLVTQSENLENNNYKNIYFCRTRNKYVVQIKRQGFKHRKRFNTMIEAVNFVNIIKKNNNLNRTSNEK